MKNSDHFKPSKSADSAKVPAETNPHAAHSNADIVNPTDAIKRAADKHWHWLEMGNESAHTLKLAEVAFENATNGIVVMSEQARILRVNKSYLKQSGYSEQDLMGCTPKSLQNNHIWQTLKRTDQWSDEVTSYRKSGEAYQEKVSISAVKNLYNEVLYFVAHFTEVIDSELTQHRLNELVNHDPLTNLPNRRLFNELLEHAIKRAEREKHQIALLFVDLDRFKKINDSLGHLIGDKLLYEVSSRIRDAVRESDIVARLGGDEFLVMMDMIKQPKDAALIAEKIIYALQVEFVIEGKEIFIGASVGISIFPKDGTDVNSLIKASDIAMFQVKNLGKNSHCFYSEELSKNAVERFTLEGELRHALERRQFEVHYQPQISLLTGEIIGAEALIRWKHPTLGMVSPARFIPIAEETGLIVQIGEWVLRQAAKQAIEWIKDGCTMQWISVNVSGIQIMRSNFYDTIYGILIETDCNPSLLELEITESTVMQNTEFVINTFNNIKKLGVKVAIDDFGTGYSSLSNLKRLPLSKIKIDQSFVRGLPNDVNDAAITNTINAMARNLGFSVIAEGVETSAQADFLKNMGCEEAQGYLYGRPISTQEFSALLATKSTKLIKKGKRNAD